MSEDEVDYNEDASFERLDHHEKMIKSMAFKTENMLFKAERDSKKIMGKIKEEADRHVRKKL